MGGTPSGEVSSNYLKEFTQHYAFLKEQNDPRFGLIRVYKKRNSEEEVMVVKRMYSSDEEYDYFQRELNIRLNFQHKGLLHLLGYQRESNSNLCGHSRVFELYSEFHSHNLKKEIQKRSATQDFFSESELWYLAESCLAVGRFLQEKNIYHGDLRPINIMLSDEGYVKIPDNGILSGVRNNYFKTISGECRGYLTPELMRSFSKRESNPRYNVYKADVFSLGVTLLYASTLVRPNTLAYDWSNYTVNFKGIQDLLKKIEGRYSPTWRELIEVMLGLGRDEDSRPDFLFLYPLKILPQPQPQVQTFIREEYPQPQPVPRKGAELKLINSQVLEDNRYEKGGYSEGYYEQQIQYQPPQVQPHVHFSQFQQPPPQVQPQVQTFTSQVYAQPLPQPQTQYMYSSYEQQQEVKPKVIAQPQPQFYSQSVIQQPVYSSPVEPIQYTSQVQYVPQQQPVYQQRVIEQPQQPIIQQQPQVQYYSTLEQQYQIPASSQVQYQYQQLPPQNISYVNQGQEGYRVEQIKRAGAPGLQTVQEERVERYEDNDLDRRVREALRTTQETIDRNSKMEKETQKYQYGKI